MCTLKLFRIIDRTNVQQFFCRDKVDAFVETKSDEKFRQHIIDRTIKRFFGLFFTRRIISIHRSSVCIISIWTYKKKKKSRRQSSQTGPLEVIIETSKLSFSFKVTEYRCSLQSELPYSFALYIETIRIHRRNERPILYIGIFFKKW